MSRFVGHGQDEVTPADQLIHVEEHLDAILAMLPRPEPIALRTSDALGLVLALGFLLRFRLPVAR